MNRIILLLLLVITQNAYTQKKEFSLFSFPAIESNIGWGKSDLDNTYWAIDKSFKKIKSLDFDIIYEFSQLRALVLKNKKYNFIDEQLNLISPVFYKYAGVFNDGLAKVGTGDDDGFNSQYGFIDLKGNVSIPIQYSSVKDFSEGLALVWKKSGDLGEYINGKGETVLKSSEYHYSESFKEGRALAYKISFQNGKQFTQCAIINMKGELLTNFKYTYISEYNSGLAIYKISNDDYSGLINLDGKEILPCSYYIRLEYLSEGFALVEKDYKFGFSNKEGIVIPLIYEDGVRFEEGLASVKKNGKWGFINKLGKVVISFQFSDSGFFENGLAVTQKNGKYITINKAGKVVKINGSVGGDE